MKCKICYGIRTEDRAELAEHMLTEHADYFECRPEPRALWEADLICGDDGQH